MSQSEQTRIKSPDQGAHQQLGGLGCWREHDRMEDTWVVVPEVAAPEAAAGTLVSRLQQ